VIVHRHRYLKNAEKEAPRFLVVGSYRRYSRLGGRAKTVKEGADTVRILLKLQPKAAAALEACHSERVAAKWPIVLSAKSCDAQIRNVLKGGDVQITSCCRWCGGYLLEQLQGRRENK